MRHVCKDMSQGINPEPSDEVREAKEKKKKKEKKEKRQKKMQWLISKQTQLSPGSDGIKTGLHIQSSVAENESSVGFI